MEENTKLQTFQQVFWKKKKKKNEIELEKQSNIQNEHIAIQYFLPPEIWDHIFSYLNAKDMCQVVQVCKAWHRIGRVNSQCFRHNDSVILFFRNDILNSNPIIYKDYQI